MPKVKTKPKKRSWKMWAINHRVSVDLVPVRIFSTKKFAQDFAKDHVQDAIVYKVTVTEGWSNAEG